MRIASCGLIVGILAMVGAIVYGVGWGDFSHEGGVLTSMPWGIVTLIDLYVGFFLFAGWIIFRERSGWIAAVWVIALMLMGNLISCVYALVALVGSAGDRNHFWLGKHKSNTTSHARDVRDVQV